MKLNEKNINTGLFVLILSAIIAFRYQVLLKFGFEYTDSDQSIMWNGLLNYSEGKFHEPRFYGQMYNTMMEALFAVPLYKLGVPAYKALPIITSLLTLLPFLLISLLTIQKRSTTTGLLILSIPLLLPIEYALLTSLPRGFVTGIFVASIGTISLFYQDKKWSFFLLSITSVIGFSVNANSVLISLPMLLYLFLVNRRNTAFYLFTGFGLLLGLIIHFWVNSFYILNPFYNLHKVHFTYSFNLILQSLNNLDSFFNYVSPFFWNQPFIYLPIFLLAGLALIWKRKFNIGLVLLFIPVFIMFIMGFAKVHDGINSLFFTTSRMFLALPVIIGLALSFVPQLKFKYYYFIIPLSFFTYKTIHLEDVITAQTKYNSKLVIGINKVETVFEKCNTLLTICKDNEVDLVVIVHDGNYDFINYGCSSCYGEFPQTLRPSYERRTWRLIEEDKAIRKNILFLDTHNMLNEQFDFIEKIQGERGRFLLRNNKIRTIELLNKMGIEIRKFK